VDEFRAPQGKFEYALSNLYVYFWRWALWRAFETRLNSGVIAFLTPSAWLKGDASGMRARHAAGRRPWLPPRAKRRRGSTRIFPGVTLPLCAAILTRHACPDPSTCAHVRIATVRGDRVEKFRRVAELLGPAPNGG
jgi:hypothetical protein